MIYIKQSELDAVLQSIVEFAKEDNVSFIWNIDGRIIAARSYFEPILSHIKESANLIGEVKPNIANRLDLNHLQCYVLNECNINLKD